MAAGAPEPVPSWPWSFPPQQTARTSAEATPHVWKGPVVILIHGGPGASGYMAPVARELADSFQVMEPLQRVSGDEPLTVSRHIADLHELIESGRGGTRPTLVGHSWGAMLALARVEWL